MQGSMLGSEDTVMNETKTHIQEETDYEKAKTKKFFEIQIMKSL